MVGTDGVPGGGPGMVFLEERDAVGWDDDNEEANEEAVDGDTVLANCRKGVLKEEEEEEAVGR